VQPYIAKHNLSTRFVFCSTLDLVEKPETTIKIIGWSAEIKCPGTSLWANVCERCVPSDFYGSVYPTKDAAIEAAKAELIKRRTPQKAFLPR